jgi:cob(I)alamin adenosyltransferase
VCRRAERKVISLSKIEDINPKIIIYLNRLSDYLFVLSRKISHELNIKEVKWSPR